MDLLIDVQRPSANELQADPTTSSALARERVAAARERQRRRLRGTGATCNGEMSIRTTHRLARAEEDAELELGRAYAAGMLSARGRHRVLRVARTMADLGARDRVSRSDVLTALSLRQRGSAETVFAI
jgi:magnesium chelatase family protein